ncbi:Superfamily II DNA or RNA helicase, SNF2 family [Salegentibacter agarivorans]|uniref:Superfamily II DNA or RNA helicase, SNF2 family n=1 Tax=Salegentibacter agarivorans TaxID=345907 RepID=A0A1I2L387_9FLAO|nr:SNF2-related protein [Salegentibacter agarivorans]SFF73792.1 Superfamily II DNA or RNA helicase, SNF2 family [Salegentibacter agarivorans]
MKLSHKPFQTFIQNNTTVKTRSRYADSLITSLEVGTNDIQAEVWGSTRYHVAITFNTNEVIAAHCTCPYDQGGYCKHIVNVLVEADSRVQQEVLSSQTHSINSLELSDLSLIKEGKTFILENQNILELTVPDLQSISITPDNSRWNYLLNLIEAKILPNVLVARISESYRNFFDLKIIQEDRNLLLECSCSNNSDLLCLHLSFVLLKIPESEGLLLSFDEKSRFQLIKQKADAQGLGDINNPDEFYTIYQRYDRIYIEAKHSFLSLTKPDLINLKKELLPDFKFPPSISEDNKIEFILAEDQQGTRFKFQLMEAALTKSGRIKSPIRPLNLQDKLKTLSQPEEFLFITSLLQQENYSLDFSVDPHILKNPFNLQFYYFEPDWRNRKITPGKIRPVRFLIEDFDTTVQVEQKNNLYVLKLNFKINGHNYFSYNILQVGNYFEIDHNFYFIKNEEVNKLLAFFRQKKHEIYLTQVQFLQLKKELLDPLEQAVKVKYDFIKKVPEKVRKEKFLDQVTEHMVYLSESDDYILITPVIRYGEIEAPILSRRNIYTEDEKGKMYVVDRNESMEHRFKRNIQAQHLDFDDNPQNEFYYLHKQEFLDKGWFIDAFEAWREHGYTILGFKQLKSNNLNPNKMQVQASVKSGIDWFDIHTNISFGNQKVGLKEIRKSIINKNRYVKLGDGSKGILPEDWVEKFSRYFRSGEIKDDAIRTHKSHFGLVDELFEKEVLSSEVKIELENYRDKLANFHSIRNVKIPKNLKASLRDYQKEGLNWLNFLDEFGFGGCLADDMGLGKTIQIIAYFLVQIEKGNKNPNLVIVPTSLLHNWEIEIKKFAPKLKYKIIYGINRETKNIPFEEYEVLITSYGTMLNDAEILKNISFNVIVLDESQAIKNPASKRYKAARLLKARQRIVATGTPVENNTFDLFSQLSFAMPGLFGNAKQFAADYSTPIDKFQDESRAKELQQKVHPFILRRTKKEVATELPEKTEMIVYCEMGKEQRRVYDIYKKEFQQYLNNSSDEELKASSMHILQGLTKMRQICNSPALLSDQEYYGSQSAKLDELITQVLNLQSEHKVLIFSQFVGMLELIKERLDQETIKYAFLSGKTRKRQEQVEIFQEDEQTRVFLISLKAGGTGLNLTAAEYVFIVDPWWNPAVENQAIDRAYRIGQANKVVAVRMITPNTIEEKIIELQDRKKKLVEELIHTDSGFFKQLTKDDLLKLI